MLKTLLLKQICVFVRQNPKNENLFKHEGFLSITLHCKPIFEIQLNFTKWKILSQITTACSCDDSASGYHSGFFFQGHVMCITSHAPPNKKESERHLLSIVKPCVWRH